MAELPPDKPYRLGALAYVYNSGTKQILLVQLNGYNDDQWNVPGGGREKGESAEANIIRELREELGLTPDQYSIAAKASKPIQYDFPPEFKASGNPKANIYRGQRKDQFLVIFQGDERYIAMDTGELRRVMWCAVDELAVYLKFPGQYAAVIAALQEFGIL